MTKEKGKKITIDQLAQMMKRSFEHMEQRFDDMDKRFDRLELRFDILDSKVNINHENRISRVEDDLRVIKTKIEKK